MEALFDGIDLGAITTSMTINSPASMIFAMYLAVAEQHGADWKTLSGTIQNDILKEFIAQKEYIYPPRPSMRLVTDVFAFCAEQVPRWNTISVSGYHIREAGATAAQELAFTLRDGIEYVQYGVDAGLDVDAFAPRISFFFNSHSDFFEEIAKYPRRAPDLGAGDARSVQGEDPAVVAAALPRADGRRVADRAAALQQRRADGAAGDGGRAWRHAVAAHQRARRGAGAADRGSGDAGAADAADHRARNRRRRTSSIRSAARISREAHGATSRTRRSPISTRSIGWAAWSPAIERGYPQREIAESAYQFQQAVERKDKIIVGVNEFVERGASRRSDALHRRIGGASGSSPARRAAADAGDNRRVSARPSTRCRTAPAAATEY